MEVTDDPFLVIGHVPYVTRDREVKYGTLISSLTLAGDRTAQPNPHVAFFVGEEPCNKDGQPLSSIIIGGPHQLTGSLRADHQFSSKPPDGYADYYEKMTAYIRILSGHAQALDPEATAQTYRAVAETDPYSVFVYPETASTRAGITAATKKLAAGKLAIIGLGGTGSYVLDLVAKTPVAEIHIFDGDEFLNHNAFRGPGAPTLPELEVKPPKAEHFARLYGHMRRGIVAHNYYVDDSNVDKLRDMEFVFVCLDVGEARRLIVESLVGWGIPFIDVGLGVLERDGSLGGLLRVTASTPDRHDHLSRRLPFGHGGLEDDYRTNIQVADLNCLNAALAVIKWKKMAGFYTDLEGEHHSLYAITGNALFNEETT